MRASAPSVLCVGSLCLDTFALLDGGVPAAGGLVPVQTVGEAVGGCCGNVAIALARMGCRVAVAGRVGSDSAGDRIREALRANCVNLAVEPESGASARSVILVDAAHDRRSFLYSAGVNERLTLDDLDGVQLADFDAVVLSDPYLTELGRSAAHALFDRAAHAGVFTALDLCWDPQGRWENPLAGAQTGADLLLAAREEAIAVTGVADIDAAARALLDSGARCVVVKAGAEGLSVMTVGARWDIPPEPVEAVDPTGAGDWSTAGMVAAMLLGHRRKEAARIAASAGALCAQVPGGSTAAVPPQLEEALWRPST
jgi:ribokinase